MGLFSDIGPQNIFPKIEPTDHGMLDVGNGHLIYWETCGNPKGKPALYLHGGPGSGSSSEARRFFNPKVYRIVLFDQRNCGRSTPHASDPNVDLGTNTTEHLLADMEALRTHLSIDRWLVFGSSWGSTLALAYAELHPERVPALILPSVTTSRPTDIDWVYHGVGRMFPSAWSRFQAGSGATDPQANLVDAYYHLLRDSNPAVREKAAKDWCDWESAVIALDTKRPPHPRYGDPQFRMGFARIVTHYFHHNAWLEDGVLLRDLRRLAGIPGVIVHGQLDLATPLDTAWEMTRTWNDCELVVVPFAGHEFRTAGMLEAIVAATNKFT